MNEISIANHLRRNKHTAPLSNAKKKAVSCFQVPDSDSSIPMNLEEPCGIDGTELDDGVIPNQPLPKLVLANVTDDPPITWVSKGLQHYEATVRAYGCVAAASQIVVRASLQDDTSHADAALDGLVDRDLLLLFLNIAVL